MNKTAIEMLEFEKIKEKVINFAISDQGKELVRKLEPSVDIKTIQLWMMETTEAKAIITKSSSVPLHHLTGLEKVMQKLGKGINLQPVELNNLLSFTKDVNKLKKFMVDKETMAPMVATYVYSIFELNDLADEIERCIRFDQVDDKATQQLSKIRKRKALLEDKIKNKLESILKSSSYSSYMQDNIVSMRNGRYVIPVKKAYKNNINGAILDTSSSGSTVFIEPSGVRKLQDELNLLLSEEEKEVYQILTFLTGLVQGYQKELSINIETMVHYDFLFAKAKYSKSIEGIHVDVNSENITKIKNAKHPLIGASAVPLDISIGEQYRTLVITGPNTGGKTVALKTVGLLTMMAQSGLHVPVEKGSNFAVFQDILVDIGDGQSIEQSLSTFSSHLRNIISIMEATDPNTLVILDELGAGTDPGEGMGLAISILENVHQKESITIATTHYSEIKEFAQNEQGFENGSMEFDINSLKPTYKLTIGQSGESNAFLIALRLGMAKSIVERAHMLTYKEKKDYSDLSNNLVANFLRNDDIEQSHIKQQQTLKRLNENRKKVEKTKVKNTFNIGDSVFISTLNSTGIVCELENNKGEIGVLVKKKKLKVNKKRVKLFIEGKELYPEDYDMDIVLETKENRKKRNTMKRKHVKDLKIEQSENE